MKIPDNVIPRLLNAGRREWPRKVDNIYPWTKPRILEYPEMWIVSRGSGAVSFNGKTEKISAGEIVWFKPETEYYVHQDPLNPLDVSFFITTFVRRSGNSVKISSPDIGPIEAWDISLLEAMARRVIELLWEAYYDAAASGKAWQDSSYVPKPLFTDESEEIRTNPFCPHLIMISTPQNTSALSGVQAAVSIFEGLIREVFHQFGRNNTGILSGLEKHHRDLIHSIAMHIQKEPREIQSITELAQKAGYSTDHFTRTFKKVIGCVPKQFLVTTRVSRAKTLLLSSSLTIKEIADQLGYRNAYFFSRQFRKVTTFKPTDFRRLHSSKTK